MGKLISGVILGVVVVLGFQHLEENTTSYVIQDLHKAVSECGCVLESRWGFEGSVGEVIVDFSGCDCKKNK